MNDDEIVIPEGGKFKRVYDWQPYTYHRIVKILKDNNLYLHPVIWYKCNRIPNYRQKYHIKRISDNQIVKENVYLDDLRRVLSKLDYPLKEPEQIKRNQGAVDFLEAMKRIQERRGNDYGEN